MESKADTAVKPEGFNVATGTDAPQRALVLCSGGVDSATLLAMAVSELRCRKRVRAFHQLRAAP